MKRHSALLAGLMLTAFVGAPSLGAAPSPGEQTIVFAGGCFWGIQSVFEHTKGVTSAVSGYAGGWAERPSYEQVSSGGTGHAEAVKVTFDPAQVSLEQLMKVFFSVAHDPTQSNRQGPDVGTQYRSMLIYMSEEQQRAAKAFVDQLAKSRAFGGRRIVTELVPYKAFYAAEAHHQHYAERNPTDPYIMYNDLPKVAALKKQFPELYRDIK